MKSNGIYNDGMEVESVRWRDDKGKKMSEKGKLKVLEDTTGFKEA